MRRIVGINSSVAIAALIALTSHAVVEAEPIPPVPNLKAARGADCARPERATGTRIESVAIERASRAAKAMVDRGFAPGVVMLVEQRGKIIIDLTYGYADREESRPMRRDSLFRIFSMTKPITSAAALTLVAQGKLSLADPVSKYIPEFAAAKGWKPGTTPAETLDLERPILISDLLVHSAGFGYGGDDTHPVLGQYNAQGIPAGPGVHSKPSAGVYEARTTAELASRLASIPLLNQPGTRFTYGHATDVLGRVVEVASGQRLQEYINHSIAMPLGMTASGFQVPPSMRNRMTTAYAGKSQSKERGAVLDSARPASLEPTSLVALDKWNTSPLLNMAGIDFGGAGMVSTAGDYLKFTQMLRDNGKYGSRRVIPANLATQIMSNNLAPEAQDNSTLLDGMGFGYGTAIRLQPTGGEPVFPQCAAFWGGAAATFFWVDRRNGISGVFMAQVFGGDVRSFWLESIRELYSDRNVRPTH